MAGSPLPEFWQRSWVAAQSRLEEWDKSLENFLGPSSRVLRVAQWDAELLDEDLVQLLKEPVVRALALLDSTLKNKLEPEFTLFIRLVLYRFSVWTLGATYGAKLQNVRYSARLSNGSALSPSGLPQRLLIAHATLTILLPYLHSRARTYALAQAWPDLPSRDSRRLTWNVMNKLESIHSVAALGSFVLFLWNGRYRTLADRLLSLRLVPSTYLANRQVSYEFMNRQMVWHAFTEFLLLLLPLLGSRTFRRLKNQMWIKLRSVAGTSNQWLLNGPVKSSSLLGRKGRYFSLPDDQCAICAYNGSFNLSTLAENDPLALYREFGGSTDEQTSQPDEVEQGPPSFQITTPYRASCGHVYCYVCLSEKLLRAVDDGDDGWECLRCEELIVGCERVSPEFAGVTTSEGWASDEMDDGSMRLSDSDMSLARRTVL